MNKYAVAKLRDGRMDFSKFHDTIEEAKSEAIRLTEKEGGRFGVLQLVGYYEREKPPIRPVVWVGE